MRYFYIVIPNTYHAGSPESPSAEIPSSPPTGPPWTDPHQASSGQELCLSGWDSKMRRFCKRVLKDGHNQHTITCVLGLGLGRVVNRTRNGPFITGYILSERSTSNTSLGF